MPDRIEAGTFLIAATVLSLNLDILNFYCRIIKTELDLLGSSKITVPKGLSSAAEGDSVMLGIRPEHLTVNEESDGSWESKVFVVEKLGSGTFLYLEKEGEPLVVQTEGDSNVKVGDTVKVGFSSSRCHIFDSSGEAFK